MASATATATTPVVFRYYVPPPPLSEFVGLFWFWRGHDVRYEKQRVLPMGTAELVINVGTGTWAGMAGPQSESFIIERSSQDELIGIHFKFGGASPFLDIPFGELHDLNVTLADLWGEQRANELISRLRESPTVMMKFQTLERWLLRAACRPLKRHPAVAFALGEFQKDSSLASSALLADRVGFSQRHFIQVFRDEIGLTPKLFCRVQRFQSVIREVQHRDDVDWTDVAISCGYFDQSHFIHDFRNFSGVTPTEYMELRTEHTNHLREP